MDNDPDDIGREGMRILRPDGTGDQIGDAASGLPHWTEPGTGQSPRLTGDDDLSAWSSLSNSGPRWSDDIERTARVPDPEPPADVRIGGGTVEDDFFTYDTSERGQPRRNREATEARRGVRPAPGSPQSRADLPQRLATGVLLAAAAGLCLIIGKGVTLLLIAAILGLAASEFFVTLRRVGYQPATLLGLTATVAMPLSVYWRGEAGIGVVLFLSMVFGALWYLLGVASERPVPNLGVTLLGIVYVGMLGSYAALLLDTPDGRGLLLVAIVLAVGYDVGGYFVGRAIGRSPLSDASPHKTVEGLFGGMITTIAVAAVVVGIVGIDPFGGDVFNTVDAILVGVAVAVVAPIGDLAESLMKRDLGVKDMGTILPGHGGLLDRFDALLFVLPTVYYTVRLLA